MVHCSTMHARCEADTGATHSVEVGGLALGGIEYRVDAENLFMKGGEKEEKGGQKRESEVARKTASESKKREEKRKKGSEGHDRERESKGRGNKEARYSRPEKYAPCWCQGHRPGRRRTPHGARYLQCGRMMASSSSCRCRKGTDHILERPFCA